MTREISPVDQIAMEMLRTIRECVDTAIACAENGNRVGVMVHMAGVAITCGLMDKRMEGFAEGLSDEVKILSDMTTQTWASYALMCLRDALQRRENGGSMAPEVELLNDILMRMHENIRLIVVSGAEDQ